MSWFVYGIPPIDFGWAHLKTVKDTLTSIASFCDNFNNPDGINTLEAKNFLDSWEEAKAAAKNAGWEGDFKHEPCVFWLPSESEFDFAFVFKQDNNGTTFVVSRIALAWLDKVKLL